MKENVIILLADSNYFELLKNWLTQSKALKRVRILQFILDAGLTENKKKNYPLKLIKLNLQIGI